MSIFLLVIPQLIFAQGGRLLICGRVVDSGSGTGVAHCMVFIAGKVTQAVQTDPGGYFLFDSLPEASTYRLRLIKSGYLGRDTTFQLETQPLDLNDILLTCNRHRVPAGNDLDPTAREVWSPRSKGSWNELTDALDFWTEDASADGDDLSGERFNGVLGAYTDAFERLTSSNLSYVNYRRRGLEDRYRNLSLNGADLRDPFRDGIQWNLLSGQNFVTRSGQTNTAMGPEPSWSCLSESLSLRASELPEQQRVVYSHTNRSYTNRVGIDFTGSIGEPWYYGISLTRRWGRDTHWEGIYTDAWSYALTLERRLPKGSLQLTIVGSPEERGLQRSTTQEAYELTGSRYYNPGVGFQNGKVRNATRRKSHQPLIVLNFDHTWNERIKVSGQVSGLFGKSRYSGLNWFDAENPFPDYYTKLPSHFDDPLVRTAVESAWRNFPETRRINWHELYLLNALGEDGATDLRSWFIQEDRVSERLGLQASLRGDYTGSRALTLSGGLLLKRNESTNYKEIKDLLGGEYWVDIDPFLVDDLYYGDISQNDLRHPNRRVQRGDRFGYSYRLGVTQGQIWVNGRYHRAGWLGSLGVSSSYTSYDRRGYYEKESAPGSSSYGKSKQIAYAGFLLQGAVTRTLGRGHRIGAKLTAGREAPSPEAVWVSPNYRNEFVPGSNCVNQAAVEISYYYSDRWLELTLTGYYRTTDSETEIFNGYDDLSREYSNSMVNDIAKRHYGLEVGFEAILSPRLRFSGAFFGGSHNYTSNPHVTQRVDKDGMLLTDNQPTHLKGLRIGGFPQVGVSLDLQYNSRRFWFGTLTFSHTAQHYINLNPLRRMDRITTLSTDPDNREALMAQERFPQTSVLHLFMGKSFRFGKGQVLIATLSLNNLLNNRDIIYSGYEAYRLKRQYDKGRTYLTPFASKYHYAYGFSYYANLTYRF